MGVGAKSDLLFFVLGWLVWSIDQDGLVVAWSCGSTVMGIELLGVQRLVHHHPFAVQFLFHSFVGLKGPAWESQVIETLLSCLHFHHQSNKDPPLNPLLACAQPYPSAAASSCSASSLAPFPRGGPCTNLRGFRFN